MKPGFQLLPVPYPELLVKQNGLSDLASRLKQQGKRRPVIITDEVFVTLPIFQQLVDALTAAGLEFAVFSDIVPDPDFNVIERGIEACQQHRFDSVIAIGGGSSIDACKVINSCAKNHIKPQATVGMLKLWRKGHYFVAIPTTAGTGSEATAAAVISDPVSHQKQVIISLKILPDLALIDASLMQGLPPHITAATGMDALTHAIESYLSKFATVATDSRNLESIKEIIECLPKAYRQGDDLDARERMALASYHAGCTFTKTSVGWVHAIAHQLGARYGVPHGLANAMVLPHVLAFYCGHADARMAQIARHLGLAGSNDAELARAFVDAVSNLCQQLDITPELSMVDPGHIGDMSHCITAEVHTTPYPVPAYFGSYQHLEGFIQGMLPQTS